MATILYARVSTVEQTRLGRNHEDVCDAIREFMRRGVVIRTLMVAVSLILVGAVSYRVATVLGWL